MWTGFINEFHYSTKQEMDEFVKSHWHELGFQRYAEASSKSNFFLSFMNAVRTMEEHSWTPEKCMQKKSKSCIDFFFLKGKLILTRGNKAMQS